MALDYQCVYCRPQPHARFHNGTLIEIVLHHLGRRCFGDITRLTPTEWDSYAPAHVDTELRQKWVQNWQREHAPATATARPDRPRPAGTVRRPTPRR